MALVGGCEVRAARCCARQPSCRWPVIHASLLVGGQLSTPAFLSVAHSARIGVHVSTHAHMRAHQHACMRFVTHTLSYRTLHIHTPWHTRPQSCMRTLIKRRITRSHACTHARRPVSRHKHKHSHTDTSRQTHARAHTHAHAHTRALSSSSGPPSQDGL